MTYQTVDCLESTVKIFADDLKLIVNLSDKSVVDNDIKSLEDWERKWLLEFNTSKCKVLHWELNNYKHLDYELNDFKLSDFVRPSFGANRGE